MNPLKSGATHIDGNNKCHGRHQKCNVHCVHHSKFSSSDIESKKKNENEYVKLPH